MIDAADLREIVSAIAVALAFMLALGIVAHCATPGGKQ